MHGWLVVNAFLRRPKFQEIYGLLHAAFVARGVRLDIRTNAELAARIGFERERPDVDFVLFWDKDILLARHLEHCGLRLFNRAGAIEACDDKGLTAVMLENRGIRMPRTILAPSTYLSTGYATTDFLDPIVEALGFPLVVKENKGSFGQQVYLAEDRAGLTALIRTLVPRRVLFQEYIAASAGRDMRLQVVADRVVCAVRREAKSGDFRANVTNGGKMYPCSPSNDAIALAVRACQALDLDFAGVDLLYGPNDEPILCEVNSNAHFKNMFDATGYDMTADLVQYIMECVSCRA